MIDQYFMTQSGFLSKDYQATRILDVYVFGDIVKLSLFSGLESHESES